MMGLRGGWGGQTAALGRTGIRVPARRRTRCGFALVIALSLMALLLVLLVGLGTALQIETGIADARSKQALARQNALLALHLAVGEVQQSTGPDPRITARAGLLETTTVPGKAQWTGVWRQSPLVDNATQAKADDRPELLTWLVSGNEGALAGQPATLSERADVAPIDNRVLQNGHVWLVHGPESNPRPEAERVQLPTQAIGDGSGNYAWWAEDEGVKTRVNLPGVEPATPANLRYALAHRASPLPVREAFSGEMLDFLRPHEDRLPLIQTTDDLILLNALARPLAASLDNDFSFRSEGLLTNTRAGGLRQDLTRAFGDDAAYARFKATHGEQLIPGTASGLATPDGVFTVDGWGGPLWDQLRSYYRLHEIVPDTGADATVDLGAHEFTLHQTDSQSAVYPMLVQARLWNALSSYPTANPDRRGIRWWLFPAFVFQNPYNVTLEVPELYIRVYKSRRDANAAALDWGIRPEILLWDNTGPPQYSVPSTFSRRVEWSFPDLAVFQFRLPPATYAPGEAIVFSPPAEQQPIVEGRGSGDFNPLAAGYNPGFGFWENWEGAEYNPGDPNREIQLRLNGFSRLIGYRVATENGTDAYYDRETLVQCVEPLHVNENQRVWPYRTRAWPGGDESLLIPHDSAGAPPASDPYPFPGIAGNPPALAGGTGFLSTLLSIGAPSEPRPFPPAYANDEGEVRLRWLAQANPRAFSTGRTPSESDNGGVGNPRNWISRYVTAGGGLQDLTLPASSGPSIRGSYPMQGVFFEIPRKPQDVSSIGQLAHANLSFDQGYLDFHLTPEDSGYQYRAASNQPAYAIGNSEPSGHIALDEVVREMDDDVGGTNWIYDTSYLLNRRLWDGFFFSSYTNPPPAEGLAHERYSWRHGNGPRTGRDSFERIAGELAVEGAFNVNSTSVEAWTAVLSFALGADVETVDGTDANPDSRNPVARMHYPGHSAVSGAADPEDEGNLEGYRTLSEAEIRELAEQIVRSLRERRADKGPFTSLASFVNRYVGADASDRARHRGLLQEAIDRTSINGGENLSGLSDESDFKEDIFGNGLIPPHPDYPLDAQGGAETGGSPGFLTQADLLARLGPYLRVRSDTFRIRAYGDHTDPLTGERLSRAWCEAVVQRNPGYVEAASQIPGGNEPSARPQDLSQVNERVGRQYRITHFRWLSEDEI